MISFLRRAANSAVHRVAPLLARKLDLWAYMRSAVIPSGLEDRDLTTHVPSDKVASTGIDFRSHDQVSRLQSWRGQYSTLYGLLRGNPAINLQIGPPYLQNGMVRNTRCGSIRINDLRHPAEPDHRGWRRVQHDNRPKRHRLSRSSDAAHCGGSEPRTTVTHVADVLIRSRVEETDLSSLPLAEGVLLFIDSSHVVRARGDVQFLLGSVVPGLGVGSTVHVHDVFLPWDYPFGFQELLYTEQYLLQAMLAFSSRYKVLLSTHYMSRCFAEEMRATFGAIVGKDHRHFGHSLWFEVVS